MNELQTVPHAIAWDSQPLENGQLTTIRPAGDYTGFSFKQSISQGDDTWLVFYAYNSKGSYHVIYAVMNASGNIGAVLHEPEGILPTLFHAPGGALWVTLTPYHPDKEQEVFLPVAERANFTPLKPGRQFPGDFIGTIENSALCWQQETFSDKKPDKLLLLQYKDGNVQKKKELKIEQPNRNKPLVAQGKVYLISWGEDGLLCRIMDLEGKILSSRKLAFYPEQFEVLAVSEAGEISLFYTDAGGEMGVCKIAANGDVTRTAALTTGLDIYSTWPVLWLNADTFLLKFTHEEGNGWIVIRNNTAVECFVQGKSDGLFTDLVSNKNIRLHDKALILWDAVKLGEHRYALSFYPSPENARDTKGANAIFIFQRSIV